MIRAPQGLRENCRKVASERPFPARLLEYSTRRQVYTRCQDRLAAARETPSPLSASNAKEQVALKSVRQQVDFVEPDVIRLLRLGATHLEGIWEQTESGRPKFANN